MSRLDASIEDLYIAFSDIRKPRRIDACQCCLTEQEIDVLLSRGLREITPEELGSYASNALLTVGSVDDYLYFLPRILQITATEDAWWPDPEVTARAIHATGLPGWPLPRLDALRSFLRAVVHSSLAPERHDMIDSWLCAIARMGIEVNPYLRVIERSVDAVLAYFNDNASTLPQQRLSNAFWELPSEGHDAIVTWFHSKRIRDIVFEAYGFVMPNANRPSDPRESPTSRKMDR